MTLSGRCENGDSLLSVAVTPHFREQNNTVVIPSWCSRRKPQSVHEWAMNLCLADDSEADMVNEWEQNITLSQKPVAARESVGSELICCLLDVNLTETGSVD